MNWNAVYHLINLMGTCCRVREWIPGSELILSRFGMKMSSNQADRRGALDPGSTVVHGVTFNN